MQVVQRLAREFRKVSSQEFRKVSSQTLEEHAGNMISEA